MPHFVKRNLLNNIFSVVFHSVVNRQKSVKFTKRRSSSGCTFVVLSIVIILVIMHMDANMSVGDSNISKEISHIMRVVQPIPLNSSLYL